MFFIIHVKARLKLDATSIDPNSSAPHFERSKEHGLLSFRDVLPEALEARFPYRQTHVQVVQARPQCFTHESDDAHILGRLSNAGRFPFDVWVVSHIRLAVGTSETLSWS